jgi:hypothetical protein
VPTAKGKLYVLDREYVGRIADLSPSVEGMIGVSAPAVDDEYVFADAVTLQPGTKYWFYTMDHTSGLVLTSLGNPDLYPDGEMYAPNGDRFAVFFYTPQRTERIDVNFVLRGRRVSQ